jgi:hypothetical protein
MPEAIADRGVDESFTSIGTRRWQDSTAMSTSVPVEVLQKYILGILNLIKYHRRRIHFDETARIFHGRHSDIR